MPPALNWTLSNVIADDAGAKIQRLLFHQLHQLGALDGVMGFAIFFVPVRSGR